MTQQTTPFDPTGQPPEQGDANLNRALQPSTRTPLFQALHAARYQRQAMIKQIQACTKRPLICYVSGGKRGIDEDDTIPFVDLLHNVPPGEDVELLLHTHGGSGDAAEKLIRMVRACVGQAEIHIIVPDFAKSAGTLMVLGADRVVMSDMSELGPIDRRWTAPADGNQYRTTLTPTKNTPKTSRRTPETSRPRSCLESSIPPSSNYAKQLKKERSSPLSASFRKGCS